MTSLTKIARHWSNQTDNGKGIRLEADALDLLNAIGVGELILAEAAKLQRKRCRNRNQETDPFIHAGTSDSSAAPEEPTWRSSGMILPSHGNEALARVQRRLRTPA